MLKGQRDDGFLAKEACEEWEAGDGECGNQPGGSGDRHPLRQPTHQAHVLYLFVHCMVQCVKYAASTQEEQRFEEGVREEVEHAGAGTELRARYAKADEHVAKLANRREGQYTLEVALHKANGRGEESSDTTNPGDNTEGCGACSGEEREGARHHVDTGRDHCRCMDERAHGRRTFHRWWQPDLQRYLR